MAARDRDLAGTVAHKVHNVVVAFRLRCGVGRHVHQPKVTPLAAGNGHPKKDPPHVLVRTCVVFIRGAGQRVFDRPEEGGGSRCVLGRVQVDPFRPKRFQVERHRVEVEGHISNQHVRASFVLIPHLHFDGVRSQGHRKRQFQLPVPHGVLSLGDTIGLDGVAIEADAHKGVAAPHNLLLRQQVSSPVRNNVEDVRLAVTELWISRISQNLILLHPLPYWWLRSRFSCFERVHTQQQEPPLPCVVGGVNQRYPLAVVLVLLLPVYVAQCELVRADKGVAEESVAVVHFEMDLLFVKLGGSQPNPVEDKASLPHNVDARTLHFSPASLACNGPNLNQGHRIGHVVVIHSQKTTGFMHNDIYLVLLLLLRRGHGTQSSQRAPPLERLKKPQ
mmetsp:Transcript_8495/g.16196  ORF Transcript_8495/g.16196 Transcript_8495/m.16196 type:complete len:389 (+) Transcript_8495:3029-4195(+)